MTSTDTVIFLKQVAHYHAARCMGFSQYSKDFRVVSFTNQADLSSLVLMNPEQVPLVKLYSSYAEYEAAIANRSIKKDIFKILSTMNPNTLVISGWSNVESIIGIMWAKMNQKKIVIMSESQEDDAVRNAGKEIIKKIIIRQCDTAIVGGKSHQEYLSKLGMKSDNIFFGYNAIDNEYFKIRAETARKKSQELRETYNLPSVYFLASGRFIKKKNFLALIRAHSKLCSMNSDAPSLVIVGSGELSDEIFQARESHLHPRKVCLPGMIGYADLPNYYGLAEAFIHVSKREQWGLVINEALACRTLVISSDRCGATRALIQHNVSGIVTGTDSEDILQSLHDFLLLTEQQRQCLISRGFEGVSCYSPVKFGAGLNASINAAGLMKFKKMTLLGRVVLSLLQFKTFSGVQ